MTDIELAIREYFGERCGQYVKGCPICDAWREYDILRGIDGWAE